MKRSDGLGGATTAGGARCQIDTDPAGGFGWRLIAYNGRVVGVSADTFEDSAACARAFAEMCSQVDKVAGGVQHGPGGDGWAWWLRLPDGTVVAASSRTYERYSTCRAALGRFVGLIGHFALVEDELGEPGETR
ncbi:hypothetical protein [Streptomyces liangshanensis]|uniref:DUF1508 domain-containing protein n=1 Tax=Streptomyces liangshanensis TaxID=2717324 RepID=A0A6G9GVS4_9ACTN|nr:hypothetical protein [Streptomyces liangshanensis]QIQ02176.1 hypothetical protein HA039_07580 [Streptomyces liangshanensis]